MVFKRILLYGIQKLAGKIGGKGIWVVSVTPGNFETPIGDLEKEEAQQFIKYNSIKQVGQVEEIAYLFYHNYRRKK